jgi:hypothetical protein
VSQGIVSRNKKYCAGAELMSTTSGPIKSKFVTLKGLRAKVIALAVIKNLSSVCASVLVCGQK